MKIILHTDAQAEFKMAYDFYAAEHQNLALRFKSEIKKVIKQIADYPQAHTVYIEQIRRAIVPTFPFSIFYEIHQDQILVLAIAHQNRKPNYWLETTNKNA